MTIWRPDFDPTLEIHYDLSTNESGISKTIKTAFRKVLTAVPIAKGSSYASVLITGITVITSGGDVDVYFNNSENIQATSSPFDLVVHGIR